ncbi:hypothetical protein [Flagellimonas allohymeniacidonis]|uniref:Uncharacterized protein n=1 Tax=Flagellimonas allohymeniacidonis TaxID=2517819 RepID=A0A4V2HS99_9FLAO|nr:hypothetical protein [Allomuricauda hymeniacidonis]TAI46950.1 hypothetical protein EW142_09630 [Allomuricauda hymeniacidonis]
MRIVISIAFFLLQSQISFAQEGAIYIADNKLYGKLKNGLPKKDTIIELKKDGVLVGKGAVAVSKNGVSDLKVGYWKEYTENGTLKMQGNYRLGSYVSCCMGGACRSFYYYRAGPWKIYDGKGELKYELTFEPTELHIETTCEGGDKLLFGIIKEIPVKYWSDLTSEKIFELQRLRTEDEYAIGIWTPLNGRIFVESKTKKPSIRQEP